MGWPMSVTIWTRITPSEWGPRWSSLRLPQTGSRSAVFPPSAPQTTGPISRSNSASAFNAISMAVCSSCVLHPGRLSDLEPGRSRCQAGRERSRPSTPHAAARTTRRTLVTALVLSNHESAVLTRIPDREPMVHFAAAPLDAWDALNRLNSPLILCDRDWPDAGWRTEAFASSPHRSCVILASPPGHHYVWQELIRRGGYPLFAKPLRDRRGCPHSPSGLAVFEKYASRGHAIGHQRQCGYRRG